jgi:hypothetical protein
MRCYLLVHRRSLHWFPYSWVVVHWYNHRSEVPARAVAARSIYFSTILIYMFAMFANWFSGRSLNNDVNDN